MNVDNMRAAIIRAYDNSDTWAERVRSMPENQVQAVFLRFKRDGLLTVPSKNSSKRKSWTSSTRPENASLYHCDTCDMTYRYDNPDLDECAICGAYIERRR